MNTRAKFRCNSVTDYGAQKSADFSPVTGTTPENKTFWNATPTGSLKLDWINPNVGFVAGKEYYLDIVEAPAPATT